MQWIKYEYEKEGYDLGELGWYLPDFWLPNHSYWIEIKGQQPTREEILKIDKLADITSCMGYIFSGEIKIPNGTYENTNFATYACVDGEYFDEDQQWGMCSKCGKLGIVYGGFEKYVCSCTNMKGYRGENPELITAYKKARSARFEYGETPNKKNISAYGNNFFKKGFRSRHCNNCYFFEKFDDGGERGQCASKDRILRHGLLDSGNQAIVKESFYCFDYYLPIIYGKEKYKFKFCDRVKKWKTFGQV